MHRLIRLVTTMLLGGTLALSAGTTLSKAALKGDLAKVAECMAAGESPNEIDKWGWTPLLWAVYYRQFPVTEYLLAHGADPDVPTEKNYRSMVKGSTALMIAAAYGLEDETWALMGKGAKPALLDSKNKTAADYAKENEFPEVIALLEGKPLVKKEEAPDFGAGTDLSHLARAYSSVVLQAYTSSNKDVSRYFPAMVQECQKATLENLLKKKGFEKAENMAAGLAMTEATLLVKVDVVDIRIPTGFVRFLVGPLAGRSFIHAKVALVDGATSKVEREQILASENSIWLSSFSLGGTDQSLPAYMGELIANYIQRVGGKIQPQLN